MIHSQALLTLGGLVTTTAGTVAVSVAPTATEWEAIGKLPVIVVLGVICCWLAWLLYKQGVDHRKGDDKKTDAMLKASEAHSTATIEITKAVTELSALMKSGAIGPHSLGTTGEGEPYVHQTVARR